MFGFGRGWWWFITNNYFSIGLEVRKSTIMFADNSIKSVTGYLSIGSMEHWHCLKPLGVEWDFSNY
jgi:hypothetical protein